MGFDARLAPDIAGRLRQAVGDAALASMEALRGQAVAAQVMPFDQGTLQNTLTSAQPANGPGLLGARLLSDGPYARRLYHHPEYQFQAIHNPNAGAGWFAPWLAGGAQEGFLQDAFAAELKRRLP